MLVIIPWKNIFVERKKKEFAWPCPGSDIFKTIFIAVQTSRGPARTFFYI